MRGTFAPRSIIQAVRIVTIPRKPSVSKPTVYRSPCSSATPAVASSVEMPVNIIARSFSASYAEKPSVAAKTRACAYLRDGADSNCNRATSQYRRSLDLRGVVSFDTVPTTAGAGIQSAVDAGALQIISLHRAAHIATNP